MPSINDPIRNWVNFGSSYQFTKNDIVKHLNNFYYAVKDHEKGGDTATAPINWGSGTTTITHNGAGWNIDPDIINFNNSYIMFSIYIFTYTFFKCFSRFACIIVYITINNLYINAIHL